MTINLTAIEAAEDNAEVEFLQARLLIEADRRAKLESDLQAAQGEAREAEWEAAEMRFFGWLGMGLGTATMVLAIATFAEWLP